MKRVPMLCAALLALSISACNGPAAKDEPGATATETAAPSPLPVEEASLPATDDEDTGPAFPDSFRALGTEPFWAIHVTDGRLRYMTPEDPQGQAIEFTREQTSRDEIAITATLGEERLVLSGRIEECSDGMSEREYPYAVTVTIGKETLRGCARPTDP